MARVHGLGSFGLMLQWLIVMMMMIAILSWGCWWLVPSGLGLSLEDVEREKRVENGRLHLNNNTTADAHGAVVCHARSVWGIVIFHPYPYTVTSKSKESVLLDCCCCCSFHPLEESLLLE